jgi:sugar/nucleoside kinase (ribokinase family)
MSVVVCVAGDVLLDVIVATDGPLREDDDTPARIGLAPGGQAANVAAWVRHLGGQARLFGPRTEDTVGRMIDAELQRRGVTLCGRPRDARSGAVVSLTTQGLRTLASDPGDLGWIDEGLADPGWLAGADWLHLSGYLLLRAPDPALLVAATHEAHVAGARVSIDLASAAMIQTFGAAGFWSLVQDLRPDALLGNEAEWQVLAIEPAALADLDCEAVVKRGAQGSGFYDGGWHHELEPEPGPVVDVTGAGDALAAGYLVQGPELGIRAAAECVAVAGAQPPADT